MIYWIVFLILEIPFAIKLRQANQNFDIVRQAAIILIMLVIALVIFGIKFFVVK